MRSSVASTTALVPYSPIKENINTNDDQVLDLLNSIYFSLPETAKQYYVQSSEKDFNSWITPLGRQTGLYLSYLKCFTSYKISYLNSNELLCAIVDGQHKIFKGPGLFYPTKYSDKIIQQYILGQDIDFGPIKVVYVKPGTLRYATQRNTGKPFLLGPGMHYFNDLNFQISSKEIIMNFKGENTQVFIDDVMSMSFVYVKSGYEALIVDRKGEFKAIKNGLHFLQSPTSFKTFVSITEANNGMINSLFTSVSSTFVPTDLDLKRRAMVTAGQQQDDNMFALLILKENSTIDVKELLAEAGVSNGNLLRVLIENKSDEKCSAIVTKIENSSKLVPRIMFVSYLKSFQ